MTQNARLLNWLESHDGITTAEATDNLRVFRLSQRIIELESLGYQISHTPETTESGARVIRYRLTTMGESCKGERNRDETQSERLTFSRSSSASLGNAASSPPIPCYDRNGKLLCYCE